MVIQRLPGLIALLLLSGTLGIGIHSGWRLPKYSGWLVKSAPALDPWCSGHNVPEDQCVECHSELLPALPQHGWCRQHGVHECPACHPELAQIPDGSAANDASDAARMNEALEFQARTENNSRCSLQKRRIQLASSELLDVLRIQIEPVSQSAITEAIMAHGEIDFDPTRVIRISARAAGTVARWEKRVGEHVRSGEIIALLDAADIGQAKSDFQQALIHLDLRSQAVVNLEGATAAVPGRSIQEAQAALHEARVRLITARQSLANLGLPVSGLPVALADYQDADVAEVTRRLRLLGLSESLAEQVETTTVSANLVAVRAPFDGEITEQRVAVGESVAPGTVLCVVADTSTLWATLQVRLEDAERMRVGLRVQFRHDGHDDWDAGIVTWVSPAVDPATRTVPVRVKLPKVTSGHQSRSFGLARVILREESQAVVIPKDALHWEGDCHVVFVRDKHFETSPYKVFHVRKVRPGASDLAINDRQMEIAAGLIPGEWVATVNSGILRSELLKNNLGAG